MNGTENRICRCLTRDDPSQAEVYQLVLEYIEAIPPERRAKESTVKKRLTACAACEHLLSGMCRLCGCYVELRAAKAVMFCPDVPGRWENHSADTKS